jgi:cobalt/nickel transport system permease protein
MKKLILIIAAIMIAFAIILPFASRTPDGVQDLVATNGNQQQPVWRGLMGNYSVAFANPYISSLVAGLLGTGLVLAGSFALSISIAPKKKKEATQKISS